MTVYVTYKEDVKEVRQWIERNLPQDQGFMIMGDFNNSQKEIEKTIMAQWKHPIFSRMGAKRMKYATGFTTEMRIEIRDKMSMSNID